MTTLHDRRGPGSFERLSLAPVSVARAPRVLAEYVAVAVMVGLACGALAALAVLA